MLPGKPRQKRTLPLLFLGACALGGSLLWLRTGPDPASLIPARDDPSRRDAVGFNPTETATTQPVAAAQVVAESTPTRRVDAIDRLFAETLRNPDRNSRRMGLRAVAEFLAQKDPEGAKDYIATILGMRDGNADGDAYAFTTAFCDTFAAVDPRAATAWCDVLPDRLKEVAYQYTARHWVERDAQAATAWASSLSNPALRATAIRSMSNQLRHSDPTNFAAQWAAALARTEDGSRLSAIVVHHWAKADLPAAADWASRLPDASAREGALIALAATFAESDPAAAARWIANMPASELQPRMLQEALARWATRDPASAAAWLNGQAAVPGLIEAALPHIAPPWLQKDRVAATRWVENAPVNRELKNYVLSVGAEKRNNTSN